MNRAPIASRNTAPIYANLGVPVQRDAATVAVGDLDVTWRMHWASHSVRERAGALELEFDGETRRHDLSLRAGLGQGVTVELNIPWISHDGGSLDNLIEGWHQFWGLPNGARDDQQDDTLRFAYSGPDGFLFDSDASGVGDVELGLAWELGTFDGAQVALFGQVKFDSGDPQDFTGTGDESYAAGLRATADRCVRDRLSCHAQLGYAHVGQVDFDPQADEAGWFAGLSLAWALSDRWALVGQVDAQAVLFVSDPLDRNGTPIWGTLGLRWNPGSRWLIDASFSEDLAVGTAPDITFLLGVSRRF